MFYFVLFFIGSYVDNLDIQRWNLKTKLNFEEFFHDHTKYFISDEKSCTYLVYFEIHLSIIPSLGSKSKSN